jgi:Asp-tRNA(Asn)/Glu-tRNA(Gln) amidotransferase A subunit family amidase
MNEAVLHPNRAAPAAVRPGNTLADLTATEFLALFHKGEASAADYAAASADRIEQFDGDIKAFHRWDRTRFEERAAKIDADWAAGKRDLWMPGVPVGVKDVFNTYDFPTGMGSSILDDYTPGNDARVVSNIRLQGGLVPGKTVTAEFAVHHPGLTVNPHDPARTPGTSSSGSAAAVCSRMVPMALGTQTAGSIIRPASYCGIIGWKPSFGLLPRTAMLKTTDTMDSIGLMARSIDDIELLFEVTRVRGHNYPVSDAALSDPARQTVQGRPLRIGVMQGPRSHLTSPAVRQSLDALAERMAADGIEVVPYNLPTEFDQAHDIHERIYRRALAYYFKLEWSQRPDMFSPILAEMIQDGIENIPATEYNGNLAIQSDLSHLFERDMVEKDIDALICPATADEAPIGLASRDIEDHCLIFTMVGASAMTLPLLTGSTGLPVGLQIASRKYADYKLLTAARKIAEVTGWAA